MKAPKNFAIWSFSSSKSSSSISGSSRTKKRRKRYTKYTEEKEAEDENWQKNADFCHFKLYFKVRKSVLSYVVNNFWYDPFLSVLPHVWRSRIRAYQFFYQKKQSSLPWNKVKAPKKFAIWSFSSSKSSSSISGSSRTKKKEEKDTQNTRKKKKQRTKTDQKNAEIFYIFLVSNPI